ncbi:Aste57867_13630 [Aphanomyces stellatus]|uniref:Aste57867_13630 protein n=1 Tax=Aphanomyces stellatus TaxID=120398 RepID=A0A485L0C3_9STRA|nr:hypothetical protein As57867_013580 [Aphanomyces stellatus]VFT90467.1 Aste57867_13630 [Aphanomyces stellatus]
MADELTTGKLRILCLHGKRTNVKVITDQIEGFRQSFGAANAEFIAINAPFPATKPADELIQRNYGEKGRYYEWRDKVEDEEYLSVAAGWGRALSFLQRQIVELGPFDVVLGFSQGAIVASILTAHYQSKGEPIPYKAVVLVSGFGFKIEPQQMIDIPSIHILGEEDEALPHSRILVDLYTPTMRSVYTHADGHRFPVLPKYKPMYDEIAKFLRRVCRVILNRLLAPKGSYPDMLPQDSISLNSFSFSAVNTTEEWAIEGSESSASFACGFARRGCCVPNNSGNACRHGWRTSSAVISLQVAGFRQAFGPTGAEFISLNAPFPASGPAQEGIRKFFGEKGPYYEWWDAVKVPDTDPPKTVYNGWERSLSFVQQQIHDLGPFDVVLGFSQGAALTTLLTTHYQMQNGGAVPYKAVVLVCGLVPRDGVPLPLPQLDIPSVHILGEQDSLLPLSEKLVDAYTDTSRLVHSHAEGHRFPALPKYKPMYVEAAHFLRQACAAKL